MADNAQLREYIEKAHAYPAGGFINCICPTCGKLLLQYHEGSHGTILTYCRRCKKEIRIDL